MFEGRPLVDLLAVRDVGSIFRFLGGRGWSRSALAAATGLTETRVRAVAKGTQAITSYDVLARVADGFAIDRGLMGLASIHDPSPHAKFGATSDRPPPRRGVPMGTVVAVNPGRRPASASDSTDDPDLLVGDDLVLTQVREVAERYLREDAVVVYTRGSALADQSFARLFREDRAPRDDYDGTGYLYAMLAWMAGDLGRRQAAEAHARSAWLCASLSGSSTLRAWVLSTMSKTALWEGRPQTAAELAARGQRFAGGGTVGVMLACQEADAWAAYGAAEPARDALSAAAAAADVATADEVGGLLSCGPLRYLNYASAVLVKLGDAKAARGAANEGLRLAAAPGPSPAYGTVAQTRISAALACIQGGEIEEATDLLSPVLATPPAQRLAPVAIRMLNIERAVAARPVLRSSPVAASLVESIGDFCVRTAGHELPY